MILYQATTKYFCVGLLIEGEIIIEAAPIIRWSVNKRISTFRRWVENRDGKLVKLKAEDNDANIINLYDYYHGINQ